MTVKELKEKLTKYPDSMDVFLCGGKTEFEYGLLNSVKKKKIHFSEGLKDSDLHADVDCVVLDEE